MADEDALTAKDFGATFQGFLKSMAAHAPAAEEPVFLARLRAHFGADPAKYPIVSEKFAHTEHANLHLALEAYLQEPGRTFELLGIVGAADYFGVKLAQLIAPRGRGLMGEGPGETEGPVQYTNISLGEDRVLACVETGLYLVRAGEERSAILIAGPTPGDWRSQVRVEVMAPDSARAEAVLAWVRATMRKKNIYRGRVISLRLDEQHQLHIDFHRLPAIGREEIILPPGLLERIERLTIGFSKHADRLKAAGRHLKRGLLLYGPPGTGKTMSAMYLAGRSPERTIILLTGGGLGLIETSCALARTLQPATLILEDVDLIAEERTHQNKACNTVLFELLNQMDGLAEDADILFLLTTNRPDILEPALASRPGRIDQALEVPLPDADARRRLIALYARGTELVLENEARLIQKTEGVSAAFIRELLRKASLFAADEDARRAGGDGQLSLRDAHFEEAIHELIVEGGPLTKSLLGAAAMAG